MENQNNNNQTTKEVKEIKKKAYQSKNIKPTKFIQPGQNFSREQEFLREIFGHGGRAIFGNPYSECLPKRVGMLDPQKVNGYPSDYPVVADCFGFGIQEKRTGSLFGL